MNESPVLLHIWEIETSDEPAAVASLEHLHGSANIVYRLYHEVARYG